MHVTCCVDEPRRACVACVSDAPMPETAAASPRGYQARGQERVLMEGRRDISM